MPEHRLTAVVSPVMVGRLTELQRLFQLAAETAAGQGQTLFVAGEAGVGKSRLLTELRAQLTSPSSAQTPGSPLWLEGQCFESDRLYPYTPIADLLRTLLDGSPDAIAEHMGPAADELGTLVRQLHDPSASQALGSGGEPAFQRRGFHEALAHLLLYPGQARLLFTSPDRRLGIDPAESAYAR